MQIGADFYTDTAMSAQYTCDGEGIFPPLTIEYIPEGAKSLTLIVDDPDAPSGVRDHLLLANIPVNDFNTITISQDMFDQGILGQNSRGEQKWGAPCPPDGEHRYVFTVYALPEMLDISAGFTKDSLISLMSGKIIEQSEIVGLYEKNKS